MESIFVEESVYRWQYSSDNKPWFVPVNGMILNDPKPVFNNPTFGNFRSATILITNYNEPMMCKFVALEYWYYFD